MKFDKMFISKAVLTIAIFLILDTIYGQTIIDTQKIAIKKSAGPECHLTDYEKQYIFTKTDILASFKNSAEKWFEFAQTNFDFKSVAKQLPDTVQYFLDSIFVRFIVTKTGQVCKIEILKGNPILADPVIQLLKKSAQWEPASSEGRNLNAYRILKIEILLDQQKNEFKIKRNFNSYFNRDG